jgi:uncharacterized protein
VQAIISTNQDDSTLLRPVSPGERIQVLDILRGFALFGVLLAYTVWNLGSPPEQTYSNTDRLLNQVLSLLVDTKFYTLFAFLFGLGFSIQLTRAEGRGISIVPIYCRRLWVLFLIGLVHALLLRNGDILVPYAAMGFILLLFRHASNKVVAVGAILALLFPYIARSIWGLTGIPLPQRPDAEGLSYLAENYAWVKYWYSTAIFSWPSSLPMFFFGLFMGRRRFFKDISAHRKRLMWALAGGLCLGVFIYLVRESLFTLWPYSGPRVIRQLTFGLLWSAHAWCIATFYAASLMLLSLSSSWQRWLSPLAAVGRMALTNYLLQAIIIVPLCAGFGLFGRFTPTLGVILALAVWSIQVPASVWWLKRFRFGPFEWIWRSLTYGRIQPIRSIDESLAT